MTPALLIAPLGKLADKQAGIAQFSCGQPDLDAYLTRYASQDVRRNVARVFVATVREEGMGGDSDAAPPVAGFYTLSAASVQCTDLPVALAKKLPRYPIPVALLGRLAVSSSFQGQGIGSVLLVDACKKVLLAEAVLAVAGLVVDAKDEAAARFYRHFGFEPLVSSDQRLFLPLHALRRLG